MTSPLASYVLQHSSNTKEQVQKISVPGFQGDLAGCWSASIWLSRWFALGNWSPQRFLGLCPGKGTRNMDSKSSLIHLLYPLLLAVASYTILWVIICPLDNRGPSRVTHWQVVLKPLLSLWGLVQQQRGAPLELDGMGLAFTPRQVGNESILATVYMEAILWKINLKVFKVPYGKAGKVVVSEMASLFKAFAIKSALESIAIKAAILLPILALQNPNHQSKMKEHITCLERRLAIWKEGNLLRREDNSMSSKHLCWFCQTCTTCSLLC